MLEGALAGLVPEQLLNGGHGFASSRDVHPRQAPRVEICFNIWATGIDRESEAEKSIGQLFAPVMRSETVFQSQVILERRDGVEFVGDGPYAAAEDGQRVSELLLQGRD